jgi:hypothetical protein
VCQEVSVSGWFSCCVCCRDCEQRGACGEKALDPGESTHGVGRHGGAAAKARQHAACEQRGDERESIHGVVGKQPAVHGPVREVHVDEHHDQHSRFTH